MTYHSGKGYAKGKGQGQPNPGSGGSQGSGNAGWQPVNTWSANGAPVYIQVTRGPETMDRGVGPEPEWPNQPQTGGSRWEPGMRTYQAPCNSVNNRDPPDWHFNNPDYDHLASTDLPIPHGPLDRTRFDGIYLIDECSAITGATPRSQIKPYFPGPWQYLREENFAEWRTWKFIRNWRVLTHWVLRHKHKQRLWHNMGEWLKVVKARGEDRPISLNMWGDLPPGKALGGDFRTTFPNAKHIDRSEPREPSKDPQGNIMTRHRILPADDTVYTFYGRVKKSHR